MQPYIFISLFIAFLWGLHPIVIKRLLEKFNYFTILFFTNTVMFTCVLLLCYSNTSSFIDDLSIIDTQDLLTLMIVPIFTAFIGNYLYYNVLKTHESSIVSALVYSAPVFTLILAHLFTNERLTLHSILGILMVSVGVILISLH
uniref:EamA domain-containing protein n=1 Tax=viral metagenome TaxID=1070528 RepID=A0A6C0I2T4_9ZZZZ